MVDQHSPRRLSIIIPTLNEAAIIEHTLRQVRERALDAEIIVVDGESTDDTVARAKPLARVIQTRRGRGPQLNAAVQESLGEALLFLHADTVPDPGGIEELLVALNRPEVLGGAFRLRFDDARPVFQQIATQITRRSLRTRSYTGDQGIFVRRSIFLKLGGYRPWQFMEDVDLSERLAKQGSVVLLDSEVETSARRHRAWGLPRTQATVVLIRALYLARVRPDRYAWLWPEVR
jgi:rSAM/selenodomain-associated transferase 2